MNYDEIKVWDGYNCSFCEHKHPLKPECKEKKFCALEIDRTYEKGRADAIDEYKKLLKDYFVIPHDLKVIDMYAEQLRGKKQ